MVGFEDLTAADIHVYATGQTWIEAADGPHNVDALEAVRSVFFEDRCVLDGVFVRSRRSVDIARTGVPWRRGIGMVIGNLTVLDNDMVRKDTTDSLVEAARDRVFR